MMGKIKGKTNTIIRTNKRENPYVMIDKYGLNDERLCWKTKGLLAYLLSKPDDWQVYESDLVKRATDGRDSVRTGLRELEKFGYLSRRQIREENGVFGNMEYIVYERPITLDSTEEIPADGKSVYGGNQPQTENPFTENPSTENPLLLNNDSNNNDLNKDDDEKRIHLILKIEFIQTELLDEKMFSRVMKRVEEANPENLLSYARKSLLTAVKRKNEQEHSHKEKNETEAGRPRVRGSRQKKERFTPQRKAIPIVQPQEGTGSPLSPEQLQKARDLARRLDAEREFCLHRA